MMGEETRMTVDSCPVCGQDRTAGWDGHPVCTVCEADGRSDAIPEAARQAAHEAIVAVVQDHLAFNVAAYGKAWTGEDEDTEFIVADAAQKALAAAAPLLPGGEDPAVTHDRHMRHVELLREQRDGALAEVERLRAALANIASVTDEDVPWKIAAYAQFVLDAPPDAERASQEDCSRCGGFAATTEDEVCMFCDGTGTASGGRRAGLDCLPCEGTGSRSQGDEAETVARLRRQNKEHAERRDREVADLQKRVARMDHLMAEARRRMEHAAVDWTTDPPSQRPGGWWRYTSINNVYEVTVMVEEIDRLRAALDALDASGADRPEESQT